MSLAPPLGLLAELTHRCPLQCPYCANPLELERARNELSTVDWCRVFDQAAALGVLQVHFSGGEPMVRRDLAALVGHAAKAGLYTNLITSGVRLDAGAIKTLADAGLEHVQLSFQDAEKENANRLGGMKDAQTRKLRAARLVRQSGLALTANFVVHRQNLENLPAMLALGEELEAGRIEIAHVQYYGWALRNRPALLPSREQVDAATALVETARARLLGRIVIDYVVPDYYAERPKPCMAGWGRRFLNVTPSGTALPCHAAATLPGLQFPNVRTTSLAAIWEKDPGFAKFRGTSWMMEPCRSCARREIDWGGCRCQAYALTGDETATDPACVLSPHRYRLIAITALAATHPALIYRRLSQDSTPIPVPTM